MAVFSLAKFGDVTMNLSFDSDIDYDHCVGRVEVYAYPSGYEYYETFTNPTARDFAIAKGYLAMHDAMLVQAGKQRDFAKANGFPHYPHN